MFVRLTRMYELTQRKNSILVDANSVIAIEQDAGNATSVPDTTTIYLSNGEYFSVVESAEEVMQLVEDAEMGIVKPRKSASK